MSLFKEISGVAMALGRGMCSEPSAMRLKTSISIRFDTFFALLSRT